MTLPTAPTRTMDQDTFDTTTDAFIGALPQFETDMNALAAAMSLNSTTDTSVSSVAIGTGSKTFTVSAGKSFWPGMWLVIADTAAPTTNAMFCQVTSYSGTTLIVNSHSTQGSGTIASWQISQSAPAALGGLYAALNGSTTQDFSTKILTLDNLLKMKTGANIASAATIDLSTATGNLVHITGTTPTSAVTMATGEWVLCVADAAWPLTYHATTNKISGGADYTLTAGDMVLYTSDGTTVRGVIFKAASIAASQAEMEAVTSNTVFATPLNMKWHPGIAKAWVNFNGTGTVAINASYNVASITDNGVGLYAVNLTSALSSGNCAVSGWGISSANPVFFGAAAAASAPTTSAITCGFFAVDATGRDVNPGTVTIMGDL